MTIRLNGQTSGYVELEAPATAGSNTLVLPNGNGTSGQYLQTNGSGTLSWATVTDTGTQWTDGSKQNLNTNTSITFSSIPSTAVFIQITILEMSFNDTSDLRIRIGDSSGEGTSGYVGKSYATSSVGGMSTDAFGFSFTGAASYKYSGQIQLWNHDSTDWISEGRIHQETVNDYMGYTGRKTLSGDLTQVRLFGSNGGTFDSGSVTLHYLTSS